jgi:hypothetical protein
VLITAEGGLYVARENLKLALLEPWNTDSYRRYVESLHRQVEWWERQVKRVSDDADNQR